MAKKPEKSPFDPAGMMEEFFSFYDPDAMKDMFDPQKFMERFKSMTPGNVDMSEVVDRNRRNFEALVEANKSAADTYRDMLEKQMTILNRMTDAAKNYTGSLTASGDPDAMKKAYADATEKALTLMKEMAEETRTANEKVFNGMKDRIASAMKDVGKD
ncbi:phasin family protein [Hoeflea sp. CAU 1731]